MVDGGDAMRGFAWLVVWLPGVVLGGEPIVIAHRGASGYLPEHTLEAVAMAHAQGAHYIEQDLVLSKDHVPVVLHDTVLDAVTDVAQRFPDRKRGDGRYYAIDFTLAELKTLNVHERVNERTGQPTSLRRFPPGQGTFRIPTLEEELQLIDGLNKSTGRVAGIYPELKGAAFHRSEGVEMSPIVLRVLKQYGYGTKEDPCYLQCFEFDEVRRLREEFGYKGRLIQLLGGRRGGDGVDPTSAEGLDGLAKLVDGIGPALPMVVRMEGGVASPTDLVKLAHERKLEVHPYTFRVDTLPAGADVRELLRVLYEEAGVDGLFTDHPDVAVGYLKTRPGR
jgi:glycerophosphoryl diester phosphodiesterase